MASKQLTTKDRATITQKLPRSVVYVSLAVACAIAMRMEDDTGDTSARASGMQSPAGIGRFRRAGIVAVASIAPQFAVELKQQVSPKQGPRWVLAACSISNHSPARSQQPNAARWRDGGAGSRGSGPPLTVDAELARGLPNLGPTDKSRRRRGLKVQLPRPGLLCATWERPRERSRFFFRIAAWHPPHRQGGFPLEVEGRSRGPTSEPNWAPIAPGTVGRGCADRDASTTALGSHRLKVRTGRQ
ncbi:hypothetical protein MRX96_030962 [Rhipicephalus microplus]